MKYILVIISVWFLISCRKPDANTGTGESSSTVVTSIVPTSAQYQAAGIELGHVERRAVGTTLAVNGVLDVPPQNLTTIAAPMGGFVKSTKLLQGMKVKKGEILAVMEHQDYIQLQQDYLETKSKLEYAGTEYERQEQLASEDINTKKALQQARAQYQTLKATVAGLEAKLEMINLPAASLADGNIRRTINLYAPIGGYVTEVNVNLGQYVNATDVMFKIVNIEHLHAELQVYERDIHHIKIGQKVSFQLANENKMRLASVYLIGKEISADRTVRIHCHLEEEDESLLPGMYIKATIETALHDADVLPAEAVVGFEGEFFVFAEGAKKGQFDIIKVTTGNSTGDHVEVQLPDTFDRSRPVVRRGAFELLGILKNQGDE